MPEPKPAAATGDNWAAIKTALAERITRRWNALARLSSGTLDTESIESRLAAIGDDAGALIALFDEVERRIDRAFANQSRRTAQADRRGPDPVEFKSK
jgi:hypothetical protein